MVRRSSYVNRDDDQGVSPEAAFNDGASDLGSDIMTVSDIHTITNEHEMAMMQQQRHLDRLPPQVGNHADIAAGFGGNALGNHLYSHSDIKTIDNDNGSIISDLQNTVGTGGGGIDDIHTVEGTMTGSYLASTSNFLPNSGPGPVILGVASKDALTKQPATEQTAPSSSDSFWSRTRRSLGLAPIVPINTQRTTECDEFFDEGRPIPNLDSPVTMSDPEKMKSNGGANSTPPPAVIVTRNIDYSNQPSVTQAGYSYGGGDSASNTFVGTTASVWKQRLCGLRADRLILLLLFVLLAAVGVIVGAIVVSQQQNENTSRSSSSSNSESDRPGEEIMINLTRTPTTIRPSSTPPTISPISTMNNFTCDNNITLMDDLKVTFPVTNSRGDIQYRNCTWVSGRTQDELDSLCQPDTIANELCRLTCQNCNELPMNQKKPWPVELCGQDSGTASFDAGNGLGAGNCLWLSNAPLDIDRLCQPRTDAYNFCRETCRNCGPYVSNSKPPTNIPTIAPTIANVSDAPSVFPSATPSFAPFLTDAPFAINVVSNIPSAVPSPLPIVTAAPVAATLAPSTVSPVIPVVTLQDIILSASPSSSERLATPGSPQSQALQWVQTALDSSTFGPSLSDERTVQLWSLATFAYSFGFDSQWIVNGGNDECLWDGIVCDSSTRAVSGINLESRALTGSFPPEISLLSGLLGVNLSSNNIEGTLPEGFGSTFQKMEDLRFDRNDISGTIPTTIGSMTALRIWYMERNPKITGTIPDSVVQLSNLEEFVLYYTDITGAIPQGICDIPNLSNLALDCTKISFVGDECWDRCLFLCGGDSGVPCNN